MVYNPSPADSFLSSWGFKCLVWQQNVRYRVHKSLPLTNHEPGYVLQPSILFFFFNASVNIIVPSTHRSSKRSVSFTFSHHNLLYVSVLLHTRHMLSTCLMPLNSMTLMSLRVTALCINRALPTRNSCLSCSVLVYRLPQQFTLKLRCSWCDAMWFGRPGTNFSAKYLPKLLGITSQSSKFEAENAASYIHNLL